MADECLHSAERNYNRDRPTLENIANLNDNDPNASRTHIKRMGGRAHNMPLNRDEDGMKTTDILAVTVLET